MNWFYVINGVQGGPVGWDEIVALAGRGTLKPTDLVWTEGQPDWQPAGGVTGLKFRSPDEDLKWIAPVGRSVWSIFAGYLGLFAVVGIGAPFAIIAALLAFREIKRDPKLLGRGRAIFGLIMGIVFTVLYGALILSN